ncbi:MAG: PD40 domain-containing protein [Bacteroidales bacterium]|nr:PD40 domain-containing protein [Bacteroidales bacterium]
MYSKVRFLSLLIPVFIGLCGCSPVEQSARLLNMPAPIAPDFAEVTVPRNLAPLRFALPDTCRLAEVQAVFQAGDVTRVVRAERGGVCIDPAGWQQLCAASDTVSVRVQGKNGGEWVEFDVFHVYVSSDSIDPVLVYRLIEPGHEIWNEMGIYQRNLETYDETPVLENRQTQGGCMNCHSFSQYQPDRMLLHLRKELGGTYVLRDGQVERLNTKTPETISMLVYPFWHPAGRFVAFSTNLTKQAYHSTDRNRVEVFDLASDVVIYDVEKHLVFSCPQLKSGTSFETFPAFSPDGGTLFFCSADSVPMPDGYQDVHYSLCSIPFCPDSALTGNYAAAFGSRVDTLYNARAAGGSISFPRVSPDGRFLLYTHSAYGNFSIWHKDADLRMLCLETAQPADVSALNSPDVESYHSWSSNGRWVVFSTRRDDGLYTRLYLAHIDADGHCSKPAPLPQADAFHDLRLMKSYNIPEFVQGSVSAGPSIEGAAHTQTGIDLKFAGGVEP